MQSDPGRNAVLSEVIRLSVEQDGGVASACFSALPFMR